MLHFENVTEALYAIAAAKSNLDDSLEIIHEALTATGARAVNLGGSADLFFKEEQRDLWCHFKPYFRIQRLRDYVVFEREADKQREAMASDQKRYELSLTSAEAHLVNLLIDQEDGNDEERHDQGVFDSLQSKIGQLIKEIGR